MQPNNDVDSNMGYPPYSPGGGGRAALLLNTRETCSGRMMETVRGTQHLATAQVRLAAMNMDSP